MESLRASQVCCPKCGSTDVEVTDSYTVISGASLYKEATRQDEHGVFTSIYKPLYQGNSTKFKCKCCGVNFEYRVRCDEVGVHREGR